MAFYSVMATCDISAKIRSIGLRWTVLFWTVLFWSVLFWSALLSTNPQIVHGQASVQTYTVQTGDTLGLIAERFGLTLDQLVAFNGVTDPNLITVGQVLRIPSAQDLDGLASIPQTIVHAQPGETLSRLSARVDVDLPVVAALNNLSDTARLFPAQPISVPTDDAPPASLRLGAIDDVRLPSQLIQGETGRLFVTTSRPLSLTATWNGLPLTFAPMPSSQQPASVGDLLTDGTVDLAPAEQFTLLPVPALLAPQPYAVVVSYTTSSGYVASRSWLIDVIEGPYTSAEINLPTETAQLLAPEIVQDELNRLWGVWSQNETPLQWSDFLTRPLESQYITSSPFGTRRSYNGGPYSSYHSGQDFAAPIGAIIRAPAPGIIALAEALNVRGNAVLIDHGRGIYTGYWHLNEIQVVVGQPVNRSDVIGLVGTTGLSTGAHLHWELRIYGIGVNPMQFLEEPLVPSQ